MFSTYKAAKHGSVFKILIFTIRFAFSRMAIMITSIIIIIVNFLLFACSITRCEELQNDFANLASANCWSVREISF